MDVYHECRSRPRGSPAMTKLPASRGKLPYRQSIMDYGKPSADVMEHVTVKYWQPHQCRDCGLTVYELVDGSG